MTFSRLFLLAPLFFSIPCFARPSTPVQTWRLHKSEVVSLAWSSDGKTVASGDKAGLVVLCDARTGKTRLRLQYRRAVEVLDFSPDSKILAVGREGEIRLLNARTGAPNRVIKAEANEIHFSPDGRQLIVTVLMEENGKPSFEMSVWDVASGKRRRFGRWLGDKDELGDFAEAVSPDGQRVALSTNGKIRFYSLNPSRIIASWEINPKDEYPFVLQVAWSRDGNTFANTGGYYEGPGHFDVWDARTHTKAWSETIQDWIPCLAFSPHNRLLAVGTIYDTTYVEKPRAEGGDVLLYDVQTHKRTHTLQGHKAGVNIVVWSPDGKRLASGSRDHTIKIWQLTK